MVRSGGPLILEQSWVIPQALRGEASPQRGEGFIVIDASEAERTLEGNDGP